jgi:undecaprenyl-diphosphatase
MSPLIALLLGILEGLTEYLPVSSTGHLVLAGHVFGLRGEGADAFEIVIQLGAVLAVAVQYRRLLAERTRGLFSGSQDSRRLLFALLAAFLPTAAVGFTLRHAIHEHLFGPKPVAAALIVGGVLMIVTERFRKAKRITGLTGLEHVTPLRGFIVGIGQCFSLWPGSSRSMCTILAGQIAGLSTATAAEFSFLLALPTLGAATVYEGYKARHALAAGAIGGVNVGIGLVTSFVVAWAVIAAFIRYLQSRGLEPFGYYRIVLGALVLWLMAR